MEEGLGKVLFAFLHLCLPIYLAKVSLLGFTSKEGHKPGERRDTNPDFRTATTLCRGHQAVGRDSRLPSILRNSLAWCD